MTTPQADVPLSQQFSNASKKLHSVSNNVVQSRLIVLFTNRELYGTAISCFYHVFKTLEQALIANRDHADINRVWPTLEPLFRTQGFEKDLAFYLGSQWSTKVHPVGGSILAYIRHIEQLAKTNPTLLLAHAYTQHLGSLSGGQIIKRMTKKQMQLPEGQGTACFDFKGNPVTLKAQFSAAFNDVGKDMSAEQRNQMVTEHLAAFNYNNAIIREFRIGWWRFIRGCVLMLPVLTRISLLCMLITAIVAAYLQYKHKS